MLIFVVYADTLLFFFIRRNWRRTRKENPAFRLHFRITDLWAATLGLAPSIAILASHLKSNTNNAEAAPVLALLLIPYQLGGMLYMFLDTRPDSPTRRAAVGSFLALLFGALLGCIGIFLAVLSVAGILLAVSFFIQLWPFSVLLITVVPLICYFVYRAMSAPR